jgi:uncharacterized protein
MLKRILFLLLLSFVMFLLLYLVFQRKLLYYPTHHNESNGLTEWRHDGELVGFAREVPSPENVWLMMHGNGGQASDRAYALSSFSPRDSVFILEYPGYGQRGGHPSMQAFNAAASEAYDLLKQRFPHTPVCVVAESIGSGPASMLATHPDPPEKIVLIVPFDTLASVAAHHFPFLPVGLMLWDKWNNVEALKNYRGRLEIFGARDDDIIPFGHSRLLAKSKPGSLLHEIPGGHNDWAMTGRVKIRNP